MGKLKFFSVNNIRGIKICPTIKIVQYAGPSSDLYSEKFIPHLEHFLCVFTYLEKIGNKPQLGHFFAKPLLKNSNYFFASSPNFFTLNNRILPFRLLIFFILNFTICPSLY